MLPAAGLILLVALVVMGCEATTPSPPAATYVVPTATRQPVGDVYTVTRMTLSQALVLPGTLVSQQETELAFQRDGIVEAVFVEAGEAVAAGDRIAVLEASSVEDQARERGFALRQAELQVTQAEDRVAAQEAIAEAEAALAAARLAQARQGGGDTSVLEAQLELTRLSAQADVAAARNSLALQTLQAAQAEARFLEAQTALSETILTAPASGVLNAFDVDPGVRVQAHEPLGLLVDPDAMWVRAGVPTELLDRVEAGQAAEIRFGPNRAFAGSVEAVREATESLEAIGGYEVVASFADPAAAPPLVGESAEVVIPGVTRTDVPVVPNAAITRFAGQAYVQVVGDDEAVQRLPIETGISDGQFTEVLSGVEVGQRVRLP
jgi:HlyD family secretion protein